MNKINTNSCTQSNMQMPNFQQIEANVMKQVVGMTQSMLATIKFDFIYNTHVSEEQEKITAKAVKEYRKEFWAKAMEQAKGDKDKAYEIYMNLYTI